MKLPDAPDTYDRRNEQEMRSAIENFLTKLEQAPSGWVQWTGTASRVTQNADAPPTNLQLGQALKALLDDVALRVKS